MQTASAGKNFPVQPVVYRVDSVHNLLLGEILYLLLGLLVKLSLVGPQLDERGLEALVRHRLDYPVQERERPMSKQRNVEIYWVKPLKEADRTMFCELTNQISNLDSDASSDYKRCLQAADSMLP